MRAVGRTHYGDSRRYSPNPHAACDVEGAGNGTTDYPSRARRGKLRIQTRVVLMGYRASSRPGTDRVLWGSDLEIDGFDNTVSLRPATTEDFNEMANANGAGFRDAQ